jgi:hypothetical protein
MRDGERSGEMNSSSSAVRKAPSKKAAAEKARPKKTPAKKVAAKKASAKVETPKLEMPKARRAPKAARRERPKTGSESALLELITDWVGDSTEAERWYREAPIPAFGNKTAEQVRAAGMGEGLAEYIEGLRLGEFA